MKYLENLLNKTIYLSIMKMYFYKYIYFCFYLIQCLWERRKKWVWDRSTSNYIAGCMNHQLQSGFAYNFIRITIQIFKKNYKTRYCIVDHILQYQNTASKLNNKGQLVFYSNPNNQIIYWLKKTTRNLFFFIDILFFLLCKCFLIDFMSISNDLK